MGEDESSDKSLKEEVVSIGAPRSYLARVEPVEWTTPYAVQEDDYAKCLTPRGALERYPFSPELAMTQLVRELAVEKVQAICDLVVFKNEGPEQRANFMLVPSWVWRSAAPKPTGDFWETGYLETLLPSPNGYVYASQYLKMFGIGFWPGTLPGGEMPDTQEELEASEGLRKPLPEAERRRFCELYLGIWGETATETKALAAAKAAFPDFVVARDPFNSTLREIRGPVRPGKKPSRGE